MFKVLCKYNSIGEISDLTSKQKYEKIVSPIDYIYGFEKGKLYDVLGITQMSGILKFYVVPEESYEVNVAPAVLFECDWSKVPDNWYIRMSVTDEEHCEFSPKKLSLIDGWFEKYIDDDSGVLQLVKSEIKNMRQKYIG